MNKKTILDLIRKEPTYLKRIQGMSPTNEKTKAPPSPFLEFCAAFKGIGIMINRRTVSKGEAWARLKINPLTDIELFPKPGWEDGTLKNGRKYTKFLKEM